MGKETATLAVFSAVAGLGCAVAVAVGLDAGEGVGLELALVCGLAIPLGEAEGADARPAVGRADSAPQALASSSTGSTSASGRRWRRWGRLGVEPVASLGEVIAGAVTRNIGPGFMLEVKVWVYSHRNLGGT